jgi:adenylate cyclase
MRRDLPMKDFLAELKRRRVFRVVIIYVIIVPALIAFASDAFPALGIPGWVLTLVVVLAVLGFPLAVGLAWAFDVTPHGIERTSAGESPLARSPPLATPSAATGTPSASSVSALPVESSAPAPVVRQGAPSAASVAVLPFVNLSSDAEQEYFSDGLTEELLNVLVKVPGLRVPARTSSFAFKGQSTSIREIGERLAVRTVLEGSVRKAGERVRITAQLIAVDDGYHLWSDTYDRDLKDIFALQDEIARSIVQTLKGRLLGEEETPQVRVATTDPEAYQLFLKGQHFYNRFSPEDTRKALALFEQAVEKDPAFARAWAGISGARSMLAYFGADLVQEALPKARRAADRAVDLDPQSADGYIVRSRVAYYLRDFHAAERDLERALALNPGDAHARNAYGIILTNLCRAEEGIASHRQAAELDPLWTAPLNNLGIINIMLGRVEDALAAYEQALELAPASGPLVLNIAATLSDLGRHPEAIARAREIYARHPESYSISVLASVLFRAGEKEEATALLAELEVLRVEGKVRSMDLAGLYGLLGRRDEAFAALEEAVAANEPIAVQLASDTEHDPLREDPRWEPLLARAGFPEVAIRRGRELYERRRAAEAHLPGAERA